MPTEVEDAPSPGHGDDSNGGNGGNGGTATGPGPAERADATAENGTTEGAAPGPVQPVSWDDCGQGLDCARVAVPLDHDHPTEATIELALVRVPASGPTDGIRGSILVNPGGPGGSGVGYVRSGFRLDPDTMATHHLVGFDPRGVGASNPLRCGPDPGDTGPLPDLEPDDAIERDELDDHARSLAERCQRLDGDLLPHLSTESVVADLDLLRQALGDEQLNYMGLSYGTLIGLRYAERHPDRVGRMVLDGVVDPAETLTGLLRQQTDGFKRVFDQADRACGSTLACPDGGLAPTYDRVMANLERDGARDGVGPSELAIGTLVSLYDERLWPRLASALTAADRGRFDEISALHRLYVGAADPAAYNAVACTDSPVPSGPEAWDRLADELAERSPRFGAVLANEVRACAHWPVRNLAAPEPVAPDGLAPILVLSTTGDAATPVENAVSVAGAIEGAGLVTLDLTSHTAYGRSFCVERIVADYLATGVVPDGVHRC